VPDDGIILTYNATAPGAGDYEIWNRLGYEAVRPDFDWRIDDGAWGTVKSTDPSTDVEQLQTWNPVAWIKMGTATLTAGAHTLQIRISRHKDDKGNYTAVNYASDALCLYNGHFHPNDQYKPGDASYLTDADRAASAKVFTVALPAGAAQTETPLKGAWQIARFDEDTIHDPEGPITEAPAADSLAWKSMEVPGNRDTALPEWMHAHRYWLRTRVNIPGDAAGRSFYLHFPAINMIATVFVNGQSCGYTKAPYAAWDCDITRAVKPGGPNEVWVGIKDWFYALPSHGATEGGHIQYIPTDWVTKFGPADFTFPVWNHEDNGILRTPSLVVAGPAYTSDVFAMPSVKQKALGLEITIHNPSAQDETVSVGNEVEPMGGGPAEATFDAHTATVPAGQDTMVKLSQPWAKPKLWWPDQPTQYQVVTRLSINGKAVDARTTKFGFREWGWQGSQFTLNGVPWHGRADVSSFGPLGEKWLQTYHQHGQTMVRIWGEASNIEDDLNWYDAHGVCVRRTGIFDGEAVKYFLTGNDGKARQALFDNWKTQLLAWAKGQRNHPSIFVWSIENEIAFINGHVFGTDAPVDAAERPVGLALQAMDPTRPVMTDGGNALLDQSMPVYGGHYMEPPFQSLPEGAYDKAGFAHRQVWPVTEDKPILLGESYYANGNEPADFATVGGESAFVGKAEARPSIGLIGKMLSEGYRWNGVNFHFWEGDTSDVYYNSWQPVAVLCRQWDSTFESGESVQRTMKIFNDTHDATPITFTWRLMIDGAAAAHGTSIHQVAPGIDETFDVTVPMPNVAGRADGQWVLTLTRGGKQVFKDVKPVSILNTHPTAPSGGAVVSTAAYRASTTSKVAVFDPSGTAAPFLRSRGIPFIPITNLRDAPATAKVLIVGPDALTPAQSSSSALAAYAAGGRVVIVLEQKNLLRYQGLPGDMQPDTGANTGYVAFMEDPDNPIFHNLTQRDFLSWSGDGSVYRSPYAKPTSGGRSLVQCDWRLQDTALAQMSAGRGLLLVSQLMIGEKLASSPVAQQLLLNMISFGKNYRQVFHPVLAATEGNAPLAKALDGAGVQYSAATDSTAALGKPGDIAIINATPASLHSLAGDMAKVNAFTQAGGWIIFNNLTPEGLEDYDKIVGFPHMIRRFGQAPTQTPAGAKHIEKVTWPTVRNPLTAGLAASNIVMGSGQQIVGWAAGQYPDEDSYSYVVDLDDVAPFGTSPFYAFGNITNNFTSADGFWQLIINFPPPAGSKPAEVPITFPRPQTITRFTFVGNNNYWPQSKVGLTFDGANKVTFPYNGGDITKPAEAQTYEVIPPHPAKNVTVTVDNWAERPGIGGNIGIDNIYLYAKRPADWATKVRPMLNIGAMVEYPKGQGGIILCNVAFKDRENNPENAGKKQTILATILRNLNAPFTGGKTLIAGANNLTYTPLDLSHQANQYRTDQGWFGDKQFTFADLPAGKQSFAGVAYNIYNFTTSPVPTVVMLGGGGVPGNLADHVAGIPVGRKADALFFLQAARIDQPMSTDDIKNHRQFEMADYIVHYADGQTAKVPVYSQISVENYKQDAKTGPIAIPGAQVAWTRPYPGTDQMAVAYSMQWNNPRPDQPIQSIDLQFGPDRRGVLSLLGVTAASSQ
ncbi:MAG: hypothetical protein M3Y56_00155, partial [Armatimonadota bacterium]|nr:hypothetical protein [Armatimonadota bacterium]